MPDYTPIPWENAPPEDQDKTGLTVGCARTFELGIGKDFRERCNQFYDQYRGFKQFANAWERTSPNDRDGWIYNKDARDFWGARLHIPLSFRTIETVVPRAIANMPKILVEPRDEQWVQNVQTVRMLLNAQQEQINIDLPFQEVMRCGHIYGIGVGKTYWRTEVKKRRYMQKEPMGGDYGLSGLQPQVTFDDPMFEAVDVFDFFWDPRGNDIKSCDWVIHRSWLSTKTVLQRLERQTWATDSAQQLAAGGAEIIEGLARSDKYSEIWQNRMAASGLPSFATEQGIIDKPHELLEWHDGEQVYSVLDRQVLVQEGENICCEKPFQVYRPTPVPKQMVGIGALEPLEHLQRELDSLRSQRRDAATMSLAGGYAYDSSAIEEEDLEFGPNKAIPVTNSRPADALMPLQIRDIPGSGYQEEQVIRSDFEAVSGMADALDNSPGGQSSTATEAQLMQAALGRRIELTSRRFETEVVREVGRCFLYMDQRKIQTERPALRQPEEHQERAQAAEAGAWRWFPINPETLEGEYEVTVEGGSMAAKNIPQERSDAQMLLNNFAHDFYMDPTKIRLMALEKCGIKHPQAYLKPPQPAIPQMTLRFMLESGVDPAIIVQSVLRSREIEQPEEGPAANQRGGDEHIPVAQ